MHRRGEKSSEAVNVVRSERRITAMMADEWRDVGQKSGRR